MAEQAGPGRVREEGAGSLRAQLGVLLGVILYSTNAVFSAWSDVPGITFAFWRTLLAVLPVVLIALLVDGRGTFGRPPGRAAVLAGVFLGLATVCVMTAAKHAPVALIALLGVLTPVMTGLYEAWRGERFTRGFVLAALVGTAGAVFVAATDTAAERTDLEGVLLSLGFAVCFAAYLLASRRARQSTSAVGLLAWVTIWACLPTTVVGLASGVTLWPMGRHDLVSVLCAVSCGGTIGHLLVTGPLRQLRASRAAVIRLSQPFFATLFAWLIVQQTPTWSQIAGGLVTIAGVGLAVV